MKPPDVTALTADILAAATDGSLFGTADSIIGDRMLLVAPFVDACDYAFHRHTTDDDGAFTWKELRAFEASVVLGRIDNAALAATRDELHAFRGRLASEIVLPTAYAAAREDVIADLHDVAAARASVLVAPGTQLGLFGTLWEVYRRGGWPCGWHGDYPAGRLVVFAPP